MSKKISKFRFKHFAVSHHRSSMKVGVDGVLIGCWADTENACSILDVGTGCGLIALIMAQRCPDAAVTGIDIDEASVKEAKENVENSPWDSGIQIIYGAFPDGIITESNVKYDLIISNPPYFDSGVSDIITRRERARHQGTLSPINLLEASKAILTSNGSVAMVIPSELSADVELAARNLGYSLLKKCLVRGHEGAPYKRALLQWILANADKDSEMPLIQYLTLESSPGLPTYEYRELCKDFYLKF